MGSFLSSKTNMLSLRQNCSSPALAIWQAAAQKATDCQMDGIKAIPEAGKKLHGMSELLEVLFVAVQIILFLFLGDR